MLKLLRHPIKLLDGIADRLFTVLGAVSLSQFPQFYGQYMQRLGGHLDEARRALDQYIQAAHSLNMSLEEYKTEHLESESEVFVSTGEIIRDLVNRVDTLEQSYHALQDATIYNRWFVFMGEVDWDIAAGTWENFMPGVPTTVEGLTYAAAGLLLGWGLYVLCKTAVAVPVKAINARRKKGNGPTELEKYHHNRQG